MRITDASMQILSRLLLCGLAVVASAPSGCTPDRRDGPRSTTTSAAVLAGRRGGPVRVSIQATGTDLELRDARIFIQGSWGSAPGQFGVRFEDGGIGPASIALGDNGQVLVLDRVNRRVQVFAATGALSRIVPLDTETADDLVPAGDGVWVLVYERGSSPGYSLVRYSAAGERLAAARLPRSIELVTGLFATGPADAPDLWVESQHAEQVLVAHAGVPLSRKDQGARVLGRPAGRNRVIARRISDSSAFVEQVYPGRYTSTLLELVSVPQLIAVTDPHVDVAGRVSVCALLAVPDAGPDHSWTGVRRVFAVVSPGEAATTVELVGEMVAESERTIALSDDGDLFQMASAESGLVIRRWDLSKRTSGGAQ